ncbi:MAG: hypothetical protein HC860_18600, partial [Alkalinema sp. RU_4_3]|nr:hypothetical protein [Alkalinema sp. RU_4_3]
MKKQLIQFVGGVGFVLMGGGGAIAQTLNGLPFEETFRGGTLTNPNPGAYTINGTQNAQGSSICLTGSTNQAQTPLPGCAPNSPGLPAGGDVLDQGALRLTGNREFRRGAGDETVGEEGFFVFNSSLATTNGLIFEFDFFTYNGQSFLAGNAPGGDGFSFFLIEDTAGTNQPFTGNPGGFGGSLGYAQRRTGTINVNGLANAYIGIGFDDFGNFSNNGEGRGEGTDPNANAGNVLRPNSVGLRAGAVNNYRVLPINGQPAVTLPQSLSFPATNGTNSPRPAQGKRGRITITDTNLLTVEVDGIAVVSNFDLNTIANQRLPQFFKFGFGAATGTSTAIHEIRNVTVRPVRPPVVP